ncbi:MAG TPA: sigma-70 family RNA polymerase sigma factor [Bryobacteraceae bacterium]|nr:sigma-70 family RNA polymerase sigma factor [Bryobacteraceae bacterium]
MEQGDATAVAQVRAGNPDAFRVLVERHSHSVFRLAFRMTGNEHDAEDLVQETFLRAYRQIAKFDGRASFGTWLYRIAANCSLDLIRARKRRQEQQSVMDEEGQEIAAAAVADAPTPDRLAFSRELQQLLGPALERLSATERAAFVLRHYEGMCMEDIGKALGVHAGAAKHSVFRAVQKLRRALEPAVSSAKS